jgi:fatty-acid peroxygenase
MPSIPKEPWPDQSIALLREGNAFISNRCNKFNSPIFQTRLLLQKTLCLRGRAAAELFYDQDKFSRQGAAPGRLQRTLTGKGGVQGLDAEQHHHRKAAFMSVMSRENLARLMTLFDTCWAEHAENWQRSDDSVRLYEAVNCVFFEAACRWSGIDISHIDRQKRTQQMVAMIESPASIGPLYIKGILARKRAEKWAVNLIREARNKPDPLNCDAALYVFANHNTLEGALLDEKVAAVDLLNVIRPIVAIGRYVCFAALALYENPHEKRKLSEGKDDDFLHFVQEVRRYYPFFPFAAALVKRDFCWQGYAFEKDTRVLLDLFGTNRDAGMWTEADAFVPQRFVDRKDDAFDFIPQGGGNYDQNHRCAGEWLTIDLMKRALRMLVLNMQYTVPQQDLTVDFTAMPPLPKSGFCISDIGFTPPNQPPQETPKSVRPALENPLDHNEAMSVSPSDTSVCGEEDPGASLESFVNNRRGP